jgi:hypothetical protein
MREGEISGARDENEQSRRRLTQPAEYPHSEYLAGRCSLDVVSADAFGGSGGASRG